MSKAAIKGISYKSMIGTQHSQAIIIFLLLLCVLPAEGRNTESGVRKYILFPLNNLSLDSETLPVADTGAELTRLLAQGLGEDTRVADSAARGYPANSADILAVEQYALVTNADAMVSGFYLLERRGPDELFGLVTIYAADLSDPEIRFTKRYHGSFNETMLDAEILRLADRISRDIGAVIPPFKHEAERVLAGRRSAARAERRARGTVSVTLRGRVDPALSVILPDGSSAGTFATGELKLTAAEESILRLRFEKPGHYIRDLETDVGADDLQLGIPYVYPFHRWDFGFSHSYLRPFGLLFEGRSRLLEERLIVGASLGAFLLPEYPDEMNPEPDFRRLMVENELGFQLGWYLFSPPDAALRLLLEANTRLNSYTMTNQGGRTFLTLMSGPGLRLEVNQLNWILHTGIRVYLPHWTPANELESGIILLNGGLAWKF